MSRAGAAEEAVSGRARHPARSGKKARLSDGAKPVHQGAQSRGDSTASRVKKAELHTSVVRCQPIRPLPSSWRWGVCTVSWLVAVISLWPSGSTRHVSDNEIARRMVCATELYEQGRLEEALAAFSCIDVPQWMPKRGAQRQHNRGVILCRMGRYDEAVAALEASLQCDQDNRDARLLLGQIQEQQRLRLWPQTTRSATSQGSAD